MIPQNSATTSPQDELAVSGLMIDSSGIRSHTPDEDREADVSSQLRKSRIKVPYVALRHFLSLADATLIVLASVTGGAAYQIFANGDVGHSEPLLGVGATSALLYVLIGGITGFYDLRCVFSKRWDFGRVFVYWSLVILLLALLAFLMKIGPVFSRGSIVCSGLLALSLLLVCRRLSKHLVASAVAADQVQGRRVMLIGTRDELAALNTDELLERYGLTEISRIAFSNEKNSNLALTENESTSLDRAIDIARGRSVDQIVLALSWSDTRKLELIRDRLRSSPLPVELLPDRRVRSFAHNPSFRLRNSFCVEIQRGPLSRLEQLAKRAVDIAGACLALMVFSPIMLITALLIKIDSEGPVFFCQRRNGFNAKQFVIFKFRTMRVMEDGPKVLQARRSDPRVTGIGKVLRRSSIDELPQLLNVLLGDMSLVGPRPHALAHDDHYGDLLSEYAFRHHVKPGITGWAQVKGYRGETARIEQMKGRIDCDLWYINNWSLLLDLRIMLLTCVELIRRRNAY